MKQLYLLSLLALLSFSALCQTHPAEKSDFQAEADRRIANLNKSLIPSGILYDRVVPLARLDVFNQRAQADTSSYTHFGQAHYELYNASYAPPVILNPDTLDARSARFKQTTVVPIGVLYYNFHKIDTLALRDNLLSVSNDLYYDVAGRPRIPYVSAWAFAVAPLAEQARTGSVAFQLPANLIIKNTSLSVSRVEVTGGDNNTTITLTPNGSSSSLYYSTGGEKVLKFKMVLSNNTSRITYGRLKLLGTASTITSATARVAADGTDYEAQYIPCFKEYIYSTESFKGYEEATARVGKGEVYYYYAAAKSCNNANNTSPANKLNVTKPIIVLDGFDPGDGRGAAEIYGRYLSYTSSASGPQNLGVQMRTKGYDVIVLNFPDGADYIERNAYVLMTLVTRVNQQLAAAGSMEKITIIGPSMAGLISRYALALMEKRGNVHNTRLWVSFDAPHLGANIPIGDQWFLNYMAPVSKGSRDARNKQINSPAARQMLVHHYLSNSQTVAGAPNYRDRFKTALETNGLPNTMGFPSSAIRKIALINGSQNGVLQPTGSACGTAFDLEVKKTVLSRVLLLWWLNSSVTSKFIATHVAFAPSADNVCKVFEGTSYGPFGIGIPGRDRYAKAINSGASIDLAPGGTYDSQGIIRDEANDMGGRALMKTSFSNLVENHSFIPTKSALAYKWNNQANVGNWGENLSNRNLFCSGEIPFDAYYAPAQNEEHVLLSEAGANFVTKEIDGIISIKLGNYGATIAGPDNMCASASYQLNGLPSGATASWKVSPTNLFTVSTGTGTMANLQKASASSTGQATITFTISGKCGNESISKTITLGSSNTAFISNPYDLSCYCQIYGPETGKTYQFFVDTNVSGVDPSNYLWTITPPLGSPEPYPMEYSGSSIYFDAYYPGEYTFELQQYTPGCGWSVKDTRSFYFNQGYDMYAYAYPNPTSDELNVSLSNAFPEDGNKTDSSYEVRLLDTQQKEVYSKKTKEKQLIIPVQKLKSGTYYLQLKSGNRNVVNRILIGKEVK